MFAPWLNTSTGFASQPSRLWLWAWERPEDLRFLSGERSIAVAYFAATLVLDGERVRFAPRRGRLRLPPDIPRAAVVRIEVERKTRPTLDPTQRQRIVKLVQRVASDAAAERIQLDFDARVSERQFYIELLRELRQALGASVELSMTALASWCLGDNWLRATRGNVSDVVPMVFTLGRERDGVYEHLRQSPFSSKDCRQSVGVQLGEPFPPLKGYAQVFAFSKHPWTEHTYQQLRSQVAQSIARK